MLKTKNNNWKGKTYRGSLKLREAQVRQEWGRIYEQEEVEGARIGEFIAWKNSTLTTTRLVLQLLHKMHMFELLVTKLKLKKRNPEIDLWKRNKLYLIPTNWEDGSLKNEEFSLF